MKVLCEDHSLICELTERGLFIHLFGDPNPDLVLMELNDVAARLHRMDSSVDSPLIGILVYPECVQDAMIRLVEFYDLIIK